MEFPLNTIPPASRLRLIQASNLLVLMLASIAVCFKLVAVGLDSMPIPTAVVAIIAAVNYILVAKTRSIDSAAWVVIGLVVFGLLLGAGFNSGGFGGPVLIIAPITPVLAILLINARAGIITMAAVALLLCAFLYLQLNGLLPENPNTEEALLFARFLAVTLTGAICTAVVWTYYTISNELLDENRRQANTDHLTGICNRRAIDNGLLIEIARIQRSNAWISLILVDIDNFKRYNDSNGHQAGDQCLITVAGVISSCANRPTDLTGRFGGEEFIVILPETDPKGAQKIAEEIRQTILTEGLFYEEDNLNRVSVTLGVVSAQGKSATGIKQLVGHADDLLYQGKLGGRNQVRHMTIPEYVPSCSKIQIVS